MKGMGKLLKEAQRLQEEMAKAQEEMAAMRIDGSAGGGAVTAVVSGDQTLLELTIDPSVVDPTDVEMLEDLIIAAVRDATTKARDTMQQRFAGLTGGIGGLGGLLP